MQIDLIKKGNGMLRILPIASGSTGNCMLVEIDGNRILIDFGISSNSDGVTFVMTQPGMTPFYAAPEAIQGEKKDLCTLLYERHFER